jgi:general stress protein 26
LSQIELSYEELKLEMIEEIRKHGFMVLATSERKFLTSRTVLCISNGLTIYFATNRNSRKFKQISANPNVALADGIFSLKE